MPAYYNEIDPFAAAWLRELIKAGLIAPGEVDERSIEDVRPADIRGYTQCHFFAGIGVWSYALRLAGWPDDRPVWTGSCPCQPFSAAGKGEGFADERHLWPALDWLIGVERPDTIFGEQVANGDGLAWLDLVQADLDAKSYAVRTLDLCAAGFGAPHIRQRLFWVADSRLPSRPSEYGDESREESWRSPAQEHDPRIGECGKDVQWSADPAGRQKHTSAKRRLHAEPSERSAEVLGSANSESLGCRQGGSNIGRVASGDRAQGNRTGPLPSGEHVCRCPNSKYTQRGPQHEVNGETSGRDGFGWSSNSVCRISDPDQQRREEQFHEPRSQSESGPESKRLLENVPEGLTRGFWGDAYWLPCTDGKYRPTQPGIFPLAHGAPQRVGRLRGYGNAISPRVAKAFIEACMQEGWF